MASQLQNRIVGTLIVVALAVIILPDLLSGKNYNPDDDFQVSPLRPETSAEMNAPEFPEDFSERAQREPRVFAEDDGFAIPEPQEAGLNNTTAGDTESVSSEVMNEGWVIQLGAFRNAERVSEIVTELRAEGYSAYSRNTRNSNGDLLTLLMVGPDVNAARLEAQLAQLEEISGLSGRVVEYRPVE
ncbi:SPOR domain-containing protein [Aliidiomarina iranensis]|uniref:SPOR domain-containing protein n=1 Tax=Aliidiomarina iranensis TaxID=1434071 RepID=A0A432VWT5_9GAMM|nr:SPOR domain-containing protein [Aliidiomarina iranensis]RUO21129.1 SPOR domain-containing protein [Aliidiomarina iranensis]